MMNETEIEEKVSQLEKRKEELINFIRRLNGRVRYKKYERDALQPFLDQTKDVQVIPLRKRKNALEFQIATQAYTPKIEKDLLKQMKKIDEGLEKVREVEKARRKRRFIEEDLKQAEQDILKIEEELKKIREELKGFYSDMKMFKSAGKKGVRIGPFEDNLVTLGDLVIMEDNKQKD